jgi:hypothetical protein
MLTKEQVLEEAARLFEEKNYVKIRDLSNRLERPYNTVYNVITQLRHDGKWSYNRYSLKDLTGETVFGRLRLLLEENPDLTRQDAMQKLGLHSDSVQRMREYFWKIKREKP